MRPVRTRWRANRHAPLAVGSAARRHRLHAHSLAPVVHDGEAEPPLRVLGSIKPFPSSFPRAHKQPSQSPPPAISTAGELLAPLAPEENQ
jgi:hypothetical protein